MAPIFHPFFFLSLYYMFTFKIYFGVISRTFIARMLKLGIPMDDELLYCGIENLTPCSYSSLYLSIFLLALYTYCIKQCSGAIVRFSDSSN